MPAGVPLHPSFAYEIAFQLAAFVALWVWLRHLSLGPGTTFVLYVAAYGVFRFLVEFVRGNDVVWHGLTRPQLVLAVTGPIVLVRVVVLLRRPRVSDPAGVPAPRPLEVSA
jgi:prolipoprotein diacylglyceryltransferase